MRNLEIARIKVGEDEIWFDEVGLNSLNEDSIEDVTITGEDGSVEDCRICRLYQYDANSDIIRLTALISGKRFNDNIVIERPAKEFAMDILNQCVKDKTANSIKRTDAVINLKAECEAVIFNDLLDSGWILRDRTMEGFGFLCQNDFPVGIFEALEFNSQSGYRIAARADYVTNCNPEGESFTVKFYYKDCMITLSEKEDNRYVWQSPVYDPDMDCYHINFFGPDIKVTKNVTAPEHKSRFEFKTMNELKVDRAKFIPAFELRTDDVFDYLEEL